jgi:hypothetical protein
MIRKISLFVLVCTFIACAPFGPVIPPKAIPTRSGSLPPFKADLSKPFVSETLEGESVTLKSWSPQPYAGRQIPLPLDLGEVANSHVLDGLTEAQLRFLEENGFVAIHSQEEQFGDIRIETAMLTGQPYFLTTDAAFHALHLHFDETLKLLEREQFKPLMIAITRSTLEEVKSYSPQVRGTSLESETQQALAYLSVGLKLFDPEAEIDPSVADVVSSQVDQIYSAGGREQSVIFPAFMDDYGAYKPVGHYAGDPALETYFRGMTWFGRVHLLLKNPENPDFIPSRLPLIVTLALRQAQVDVPPSRPRRGAAPAQNVSLLVRQSQAESQATSDLWIYMYETLNFVIGPSDDVGPLEYAALMDAVYGPNPLIQDLADDGRWGEFLARTDELPEPQINSLFLNKTAEFSAYKGWRFMGQRFTLDGMILQNLIFNLVQKRSDGTERDFPSGLDVMAAFGSELALRTLDGLGETNFPNYGEQMSKMQEAVQAQPQAQWLGRFYDAWLYSFFPLLVEKDDAFPSYAQTEAWSFKDLNTTLGSWAELKHDTILYTKMPEAMGGGGPPISEPAPSYVEPNPDAFYRMAYMSRALSHGLLVRLEQYPFYYDAPVSDNPVDEYVYYIGILGERFEAFGDMAVKELAGEPLTAEENQLVTECLGLIECKTEERVDRIPAGEMPKPPIIAAVSGSKDLVLEVGIGWVDCLYVAVPLEDKVEVAQGGIFSYYEFKQPRSQRLTDEEWRERLAGSDAPALPSWASNFVLPDGMPTEWLAFRIGDVYVITESGNDLNLRDRPSISGTVEGQLKTRDYVEITGGPIFADGYTWWEVDGKGWVVEDQEWFRRSNPITD